MPGNTFQYPTSIEGVLGYNNQIVLTSGMFMMDTKWFRNPEYSYGTWLSAGDTAKKSKAGYYYYHDNPATRPTGTIATRSTSRAPAGTPTRCTAVRPPWPRSWPTRVPRTCKVYSLPRASRTTTTTRTTMTTA